MQNPEMDYQLAVAVEAAHEAGQLLRSTFGSPQTVRLKGPVDLVTDADEAAEQVIVGRIRRAFPGHAIVAEESGLAGDQASPHVWLIDPLDGTTNFAHGYPVFSVSIALESHGRLELGVVYQPIHGELFVARAGAGAELNGTRLRVSSVAALNASLVCSGFPYERSELSAALSIWAAVVPRAQGARRAGSAALDLCYVAAGRLDGYWERPLRPWDIAAGALMVQEAGGRVTGFHGTSLALREGDIVASNGLIHGQLLEAMRHGMASDDGPGRPPAQR